MKGIVYDRGHSLKKVEADMKAEKYASEMKQEDLEKEYQLKAYTIKTLKTEFLEANQRVNYLRTMIGPGAEKQNQVGPRVTRMRTDVMPASSYALLDPRRPAKPATRSPRPTVTLCAYAWFDRRSSRCATIWRRARSG